MKKICTWMSREKNEEENYKKHETYIFIYKYPYIKRMFLFINIKF